MVSESSQGETFDLNAPRDGLVVFPDAMFPGWKARLDGYPIPIYTAQTALRSVVVPKGLHRVEFTFKPYWWPWVWIALMLWFLGVAYAFFSKNKLTNARH
jgi:uncharacterized membrane protein YfhO